jgi:hypothetical protein
MHRHKRILAATLTCLALTGCATAPKPAPPITATPSSPGTQGEPLKPGTAVTAMQLEKLHPLTRVFAVDLGPRSGKTLRATIESTGRNQWRYTLEDSREVDLVLADDGSIQVPRETDVDEQVEILYEPALRLLPPRLVLGEPFEGESHMTVKNLKDGKLRDQGTVAYRVELTGQRKVATPAGEFDAYIVNSERRIKLGMASVDVAIMTAYAPDGGTVAESITQTTKALGLLGGTKQEVLKLQGR